MDSNERRLCVDCREPHYVDAMERVSSCERVCPRCDDGRRSAAEQYERELWHDGYYRGRQAEREAKEREAKAAPADAPLAYLILPHDVCRGLEDGALAACWALQASNVLDVSSNLADALRSAEAASRRTDGAVTVLAVTVAGTRDAGDQAPAVAPTCGVCHGAGSKGRPGLARGLRIALFELKVGLAVHNVRKVR